MLLKRSVTWLLSLGMIWTLASCQPNETNKDSTTTRADETSAEQEGGSSAATVEIEDAHGKLQVPVRPERVVSLDNRTFETLDAWGVKLVAAPKPVMPPSLSYVEDEAVLDIGNHREPNLEILAAAEPDLVIVGQRFASFYEDIKKLVPDAVVIDVNVDVSEEASDPAENLVQGLKKSTIDLGRIFDKEIEAGKLVEQLDQSIQEAKDAYPKGETVMSVIISGGKIGYSAPGSGRVWGPLYDILGWTSSLEVDSKTSDHQGDEISVEAIAQSQPDWLMVLDRDAGTQDGADAVPAREVLEQSEALKNTPAIREGKVVYAPNDTYTNESIQTFIEIFQAMKDAFEK